MSKGIERIAAERRRQIEKEGWSAEHDEQHEGGELAAVAALYALAGVDKLHGDTGLDLWGQLWPESWAESWWKPGEDAETDGMCISDDDAMRCLEKAGALIAAEIDRRLARAPTPEPKP